jgi:tRNA-Thr(GGU) m(6)t(6)A37 methyltransferase TsaA
MSSNRIQQLEQQIADLKKRWPAHSIPPAMMEELDALEEELLEEIQKQTGSSEGPVSGELGLRLRAIGRVENKFNEQAPPEEIRSVESRLVIDPALVEGLQGLEPGQQVLVLFYFHRSHGFELLQHPRGDQSRPVRGVFALHSPNRPNPIGVTTVDLLAIEGNILRVRGLDAINGTPLLDIKPA